MNYTPTRLLCPWDSPAIILEWVAIPFSRGSSQPRMEPRSPALQADSEPPGQPYRKEKSKWSEVKSLSHVRLFATSWTVAHQAPPSMGFSRQEYWSGLPFPSPGDLPDPGIEPRDRTQVSRLAGRRFNFWATREPHRKERETVVPLVELELSENTEGKAKHQN